MFSIHSQILAINNTKLLLSLSAYMYISPMPSCAVSFILTNTNVHYINFKKAAYWFFVSPPLLIHSCTSFPAVAAASLALTSTVSTSVEVNEPMSFTVQTMAEDPLSPGTYIPLTTGRHSILNVDMTIAWDTKKFYILFPGGNLNFYQIHSTAYTLGGSEVIEDGRFDLKIRKQCVNGTATFNDVRILNETTNIQLNFTQILPYYPWERVPPNYNETLVYDTTTRTFNTFVATSYSPAVVFSPPFNVTSKSSTCA